MFTPTAINYNYKITAAKRFLFVMSIFGHLFNIAGNLIAWYYTEIVLIENNTNSTVFLNLLIKESY